MLEKLNNLDTRILYLIMVCLATFPLLRPIGLPLPISEQVKLCYEAVDSLRPGDLVFIGVDFEPSSAAAARNGTARGQQRCQDCAAVDVSGRFSLRAAV